MHNHENPLACALIKNLYTEPSSTEENIMNLYNTNETLASITIEEMLIGMQN